MKKHFIIIKQILYALIFCCLLTIIPYYFAAVYQKKIPDNTIVIVTDTITNKSHLYTDKYPIYIDYDNKKVDELHIKPFSIIDTFYIVADKYIYIIQYDVICCIDTVNISDNDADFLKYTFENFNDYEKSIRNDLKCLCLSLSLMDEDSIPKHINSGFTQDIQSVLNYDGLKVYKCNIEYTMKENN